MNCFSFLVGNGPNPGSMWYCCCMIIIAARIVGLLLCCDFFFLLVSWAGGIPSFWYHGEKGSCFVDVGRVVNVQSQSCSFPFWAKCNMPNFFRSVGENSFFYPFPLSGTKKILSCSNAFFNNIFLSQNSRLRLCESTR